MPVKDGILLTSNRDEQDKRGPATGPVKNTGRNGQVLLYPRDTDKGGSWIIAKNNGDAAVLLNGAFRPHLPAMMYRQSRGLVLLAIMNARHPLDQWNKIDLDGIEPFTMILYTRGRLNDCRWDGMKKHNFILCSLSAYIWSSVTLYDNDMISRRNKWFSEWQENFPHPATKDVLQFHGTATDGDQNWSLVMNRSGKIATVSITSIHLSAKRTQMIHSDIKSGQQSITDLALDKAIFPAIKIPDGQKL